jgi:nitrogen fixation/metabolism regulation signal transduction histidine kinase
MRLRTRIFRRLVLVALVPAIIVIAISGYITTMTIDQTSSWLEVASPDRTINSLRLIETRLQEMASEYLSTSQGVDVASLDSAFDWRVIIENGRLVDAFGNFDFYWEFDSTFQAGVFDSGMVRRVIRGHLIVGASAEWEGRTVACGFTFDREYLSGFEAASATLRESRRSRVVMSGFVLFLAFAGALVLILIIVAAYFLSRRISASITTPLEQLTMVTAAIARGDKPQSISVTGTEEISRLTDTFNRMMVDLDESRKRLVAVERVAAWQEFARRMAHELKNPLTPISLSLYRIKNSLEKSGQYDRYSDSIEAISAEVDHLQRMADDYSSLAKLPEPKPTEFEFTALAREVFQLHAAQLESYDFKEILPSEPISIDGDPDHLRQVMINLVKNAVEFTPPGKRIIISVTVNEQAVAFAVANEGEGVTEADLKAAKRPYFSTREDGLGLGLAISEKIIIDHGGNLTLDLADRLTVATFSIPKRRPAV